MRLAIMQPYVFPYLGYFQLVQAVDQFVFYDDVNFIKRGWIHRNNILVNSHSHRFTVPLKRASQSKLINEVMLHPVEYPAWREKFLKTLHQSYKNAPQFESVYALVTEVLTAEQDSIANLTINSIKSVSQYLQLDNNFIHSSGLSYDRSLRGPDKILALCQQQGAAMYINPIGGQELYDAALFEESNIALRFIQSQPVSYQQFAEPFVPHLSIIDVLMFNTVAEVRALLPQYQLITH